MHQVDMREKDVHEAICAQAQQLSSRPQTLLSGAEKSSDRGVRYGALNKADQMFQKAYCAFT
jgi:hypothetical protein